MKTGAIRIFDEKPEAKTVFYNLGDERELMKDKPPATPGAPVFLDGGRPVIETISLPAGNPAIDRAPTCATGTDQRGTARPLGVPT